MIDIIEFTHALKSSWIRRLFKQKKNPKPKKKNPNNNWFSLLEAEMKTKVNDLCVKEIDFIILSILRNIFWKDVFNSWTKVRDNFKKY